MNNNLVRLILVVVGVLILFSIAVAVLKFAVKVLLPIAILIIAGYIVYNVFFKRKY
ncbi:MAG: hypothetical protein N2645_16100 [Clostridia bacterium]|nr:hypothetical protein [Clostridia bacterium]